MNPEKIISWLESEKIITGNIEIQHIRTGDNNKVFKASSDNKEVIVKVNKKGEIENRLEREAQVLSFIEDKDFRAPKLVIFDKNSVLGPILVQEKIGERDLKFQNITSEQLKSLASLLVSIHKTDLESYNEFFDEEVQASVSANDYFDTRISKINDYWREYTERAKNVRPEFKELYLESLSILEEVDSKKPFELSFCHMDFISNMRCKGQEVYLVDWELAEPELLEYSLVAQFRRARMDEKQRQNILEAYRTYSDGELIYSDFEKELWTAFLTQDFLWALKRWKKEEGSKREKRYRKKLRDRKKRLNHYLEKDILKMKKMYTE